MFESALFGCLPCWYFPLIVWSNIILEINKVLTLYQSDREAVNEDHDLIHHLKYQLCVFYMNLDEAVFLFFFNKTLY